MESNMKKNVSILLTLILTLCSAALADELWAPGKTVFIECGAPYQNFNELVDYIRTSDKKIKIGVNMSAMSHLSWMSAFNAIAYEADGKLMALGIIGPEAATREVTSQLLGAELGEQYASLKEQGYDYTLDVGICITLPAGTDPAIVEYVNAKLMELNGNETFEIGMRIADQGVRVIFRAYPEGTHGFTVRMAGEDWLSSQNDVIRGIREAGL